MAPSIIYNKMYWSIFALPLSSFLSASCWCHDCLLILLQKFGRLSFHVEAAGMDARVFVPPCRDSFLDAASGVPLFWNRIGMIQSCIMF